MTTDKKIEKIEIVKCPGCGTKVVWTGIYGPWCATCNPRTLDIKRGAKK